MSGFDLFGDVAAVDDGDREDFDFYETPAWMTRSLLHFHPALRGSSVLECCSGRDAITRVLRDEGRCTVFTNDFDSRHPAEMHFDATQAAYWNEHAARADYVITNPPFKLAFPILQHAAEHADKGVILLVRKTFLEPTQDRGPWLMEFPPDRMIGQPRYSFRGSGSDSVSCDWYLWLRERIAGLPPFVIDHVAERRTR